MDDVSAPKKSFPWLAVGIVGLLGILILPPVVVVGSRGFGAQPSTLVSPIAEAVVQPAPHRAQVYSPSDYIALSERYFRDAYTLAQKRQQTEEDKKEIIGKLQQAINTISEGINLYPNRAELWVQRANFYTAVVSIAPQAQEAAIRDIEQAQRLSQHNSLPSEASAKEGASQPSLPSGLEFIKDQQADSRDVIVAAPDEPTSPYQDAKESSAVIGTATVPAGQTELTVVQASVTDISPIYVVPKGQTNATITVVSKQAGVGFTVALDNAQNTDVPFQYWITR